MRFIAIFMQNEQPVLVVVQKNLRRQSGTPALKMKVVVMNLG
jgi:hypothetical protein